MQALGTQNGTGGIRRLKTATREKARFFQSLAELGGSMGGVYINREMVQIPEDLKALKPIKRASSQTIRFDRTTSEYHFALSFGVRFWVSKSQYTAPNLMSYPSSHSKLSRYDHRK